MSTGEDNLGVAQSVSKAGICSMYLVCCKNMMGLI